MHHIAIVGSGPAGYYTAEACLKLLPGVRIDVIDRLPVPFGLIRSGVAPDHQSIKAVSRRFEAVAATDGVRFMGNVAIGEHVTIKELRGLYDAVVLATGAPHDRALDVPGADLPGVIGSAAFVGWYNGHTDFAGLAPPLRHASAVVVGNGNVALDVARILTKTRAEFDGSDIADHALAALEASAIAKVTILGRRGPHQIAMTPKELGELGQLTRAQPLVDVADLPAVEADGTLEPGQRKSIAHLRNFAAAPPAGKPMTIDFDFFASPVAIEATPGGMRVVVERTQVDEQGRASGTGDTYAVPAGLVVTCIGYRTPPIEGVPYDAASGRFANVDGRIAEGLYCVGWARRGPSGTIGTNRPDGYLVAETIASSLGSAGSKAGGPDLDRLLASRGAKPVSYADWRAIDTAEIARARSGAPREKFTDVSAMIAARG